MQISLSALLKKLDVSTEVLNSIEKKEHHLVYILCLLQWNWVECTGFNVLSFVCLWTQSQYSKWKFEFTGRNQILEFIFIYTCIYIYFEKFTSSTKVLLVLGKRTGTHGEDCNLMLNFYVLRPSAFILCLSKCIRTWWSVAFRIEVTLTNDCQVK